MAGPKKVLVDRSSATRPRFWESDDEPFDRSHSDLVKYCVHDVDYYRVLDRLQKIASKATAILTSRYLSQGIQRYLFSLPCAPPMADDRIVIESPNYFDEDEVACLQSLSFAEIYARENIIEPALQHTGSWLLESRDFDAWIQRHRLDEHRGFFWIQGNPGSGKSTLMKKAYSHVQACSQDPSTVIAAFFFNARGSEIEKSPTGLFRTLLHKLCQHISALRDKVVRAYVAKRRFSNFDVRWQLSELKDFLATAVTSTILGRRKLLLIVDALDECDLGAIQSVVRTFEDLASAALSERTDFNICLSSRYWPQIRIPKCFVARVELENYDDIVMYIQKSLESANIIEQDLALFDTLISEILDKAQGTFLWVVLVVQELLQANIAGATLRELRDIVHRVPQDLSQFYQHQLRTTEGEDRERMLRLFQVVFFAQRSLSPTELRYALAFGSEAYASYTEWSQSSEYIRSDEQMERRVREHSKGLVEFAQLHWDDEQLQAFDDEPAQDSAQSLETVVQFVHQSVRDFLTADGFSCLRDTEWPTQSAEGHEFMKMTCLNYLRAKELDTMLDIDARVSEESWGKSNMSTLTADHPLLQYAAHCVFPHAAQAEEHGISQDGFRAYMCGNIEARFERWRNLFDMTCGEMYAVSHHGVGARPIHIFAEHGLLSREIAEIEANIDIAGGTHVSALATACLQGHEDTVELLLSLGADPTRIGSSLHFPHYMHAFVGAIDNRHLPILRRLLNDRGSSFTLSDRLSFLNIPVKDSSPHLEAILVLLFPEATFPESAIQDVCSIAARITPRILAFLLDKSQESILHQEKLWYNIVGGPVDAWTSKVRKLRDLLDRGVTIKITGTLIRHCEPGRTKDVIIFLLSENCEVDLTDDLMNAISTAEDSSHILSAFEFVGYLFDAFTRKQLLQVLKHGSAESAAFFLQRNKYDLSTDKMLISALGNIYHGLEVSRLLLGYLNPDSISEQAFIAALENPLNGVMPCAQNGARNGADLVGLLYSRRNGLIFSEVALAVAVERKSPDVVSFVLEHSECVRISEEILTRTILNPWPDNAPEIVDVLLLHDPDIEVQESIVIEVIHNSKSPGLVLTMFRKHNKSLFCTEDVIIAAVHSCSESNVLEIILQQDRSIKISSTIIMAAMRAQIAAAQISVMLHHDHTIVIKDEHLIAAALNSYHPSLIFELLQTRGKLHTANSANESLSTGTAKRRKVTHKPPLRISIGVLNAVLSNPEERARGPLLRLFLKWGIITEMDYTNGMSKPSNSSYRPATVTLPSIPELFPDL